MFIVLGATGHIGSELVRALDAAGKKVIAVVRHVGKADSIRTANVEPVVLDAEDTARLHDLLQRGRRAFLLNPPADPGRDTDAAETATARAITDALHGSRLEKIVVASTYGAQPGQGIGDLSVLYDFERLAEASGIPTAINRAAYYYTNLDMVLGSARKGVVQTPFRGCRDRLFNGSRSPGEAGGYPARELGGKLPCRRLLEGGGPCLRPDDHSDGRWPSTADQSFAR